MFSIWTNSVVGTLTKLLLSGLGQNETGNAHTRQAVIDLGTIGGASGSSANRVNNKDWGNR